MASNKVKGIKILKIDQERRNLNLGDVPCYSSSYNKNAVLVELLSSVARFSEKKNFKWHLELKVETCFSFHDHNKIKTELDIQEKIDKEVTSFLSTQCDLVKVVSYMQRGCYHYHWYLCSKMLDFAKVEAWFKNETKSYQRGINFDISIDASWQNVIKGLVTDHQAIYGWSRYI